MLLDDIADLLSTGGISRAIYKGHTPPQAADSVLTLYEVGGMPTIQTMGANPASTTSVERPRVQIVARDKDYSVARTVAGVAFRLVDGLRARTINGTSYLWAAAVQPPFYLDTDHNERTRIAFNVDLMKYITTATST